jgi:hypothetical protein
LSRSSSEEAPASDGSFSEETAIALKEVRSALAEFVAAVPGGTKRPTDLQKTLGVDSKICWQIINVIRGDGSLSQAIQVPTLQALRRAMTAAHGAGVPAGVIRAVQTSIEDFERVAEVHAGTRPDFDAMVAAVAPDDSTDQLQVKHRRSVYRGLSYIWGRQIDVLSTTMLVRRSERGTDRVILTSKRGLRRLRPDANIQVYGYRLSVGTSRQPRETIAIEPGAIDRYGAPLLSRFCSQPLPELCMGADSEGWKTCELTGSSIGRLSDTDLAFATLSRDVPDSHDTDGRIWVGSNAKLTTPTGLLVQNLLVHRESFEGLKPKLLVFAYMPGADAPKEVQSLALPLRERIVPTGRADQITGNPDDPDFPEMLGVCAERAGWDLSEFDGYRVRIQYPVLHTMVRQFFYLA